MQKCFYSEICVLRMNASTHSLNREEDYGTKNKSRKLELLLW